MLGAANGEKSSAALTWFSYGFKKHESRNGKAL